MYTTTIQENAVSIVEHGNTCEVFVSGPTEAGEVKFLGYSVTERMPGESLEEVAKWGNTALATRGASGDGFSLYSTESISLGKQRLKEIVLAHLKIHRELRGVDKLSGPGSKSQSAGFDYTLVKSFGYKHATALLTDLYGIPKTTITRRIDTAKQRGVAKKHSHPWTMKPATQR